MVPDEEADSHISPHEAFECTIERVIDVVCPTQSVIHREPIQTPGLTCQQKL
jgi:hypothetical protein